MRLCFAHPGSAALAVREVEEHLLDVGVLATKVRTTLSYFRPLVDAPGCEIRLHRTTVYASMFRFDDQLLANPHIYAAPASANPLLQLTPGHSMFDAYTASFETVWAAATTWSGGAI